jgi:hypothetical protein
MENKQPTPTQIIVPTQAPVLPPVETKKSPRKLIILLVCIVVAGIAATLFVMHHSKQSVKKSAEITSNKQAASKPTVNIPTISASDLKLDETKNYGNKYADGMLPVGDGKYVTDKAKAGYIYMCHAPQEQAGGAGTRGPWFTSNNTQYDINKKAKVAGSVSWQSSYSMKINGKLRTISTNDLPINHSTGIFPVQPGDAAYAYDRNPNSIASQSLTYTLTAYPQVGSPDCMGGEVGIMNTGVALFSGFDAGGRDAGAWEVQDSCSGHPQNTKEYHYHSLSACIDDTSVKTVIGYALDGFPITGPKMNDGNILTTSDLDECHGITSELLLDGKRVTSYHYVMTQDFPYSVSCFKATPIQPPGQTQQGQQVRPKPQG